jgi:hypothetical protein
VSPTRIALCAVLIAWPARGFTQQVVTRNPHGKLAEECAVCHSPEAWTPARISSSFDHAKKGFVLAGAHRQTACRSCHASLDFHDAARDCASCHRDVHRGELGTDCARCHTPRSFLDRSSMTRAHQLTRFPLTGTHITLDCESCHTPAAQGQMTFVNAPAECVECHLPQYQSAKNPDHAGGQYPRDCGQCHLTTVWASARFNHDATGFPLTGMHGAAACQQCHGDGIYAGKSHACVSCHLQDYNGTTNPVHASAGFPTSCETCHTTAGWTGASFNHTWFPVPHRTATQCSDCHLNTSNFSAFVCTNCHTQAQTDPHHTGVRGYIWNSANCYACHRSGRAG